MNLHRTALFAAAALLAVVGNSASAQHSDIEIEYHNGHIDILGGHSHHEGEEHGEHEEEEHEHGGLLLFEADFGDFDGGPFFTDDPGYGAEAGGLTSEAIIGFNAVGPLLYHDGSDFAATTAIVTVENGIGSDVDISALSFVGSGFIGQAGTDGSLHTHIDYSINEEAAFGAYMIEMTLSGYLPNATLDPTIEDSDSFYIVFNHGLGEEDFHEAFEAFEATLVPEPSSAMALLAGAGLLAARRRRRD